MKSLKRIVLSIVLFILCSNVFASHFINLDLYYRWVSDSTYEITASFNRSCMGFTATAPSTLSIQVTSTSNNYSALINSPMLPATGSVITNVFNCANTQYCAEEYVYRGTWTAPFRADDFIFSYSLCCMPTGLAGPDNVFSGVLYVDCGLNNLDFPNLTSKNNSPFWHNIKPVHTGHLFDTVVNPGHVSLCEATNVVIDQSVVEYDNDFVKYKMINPRSNVNTNLSFINGWSLTNPMTSNSGPVSIDSIMGTMTFTVGPPTGTGVYMITLQATEYRYDTISVGPPLQVELKEIGYVTRNLFVYVNDSATCPGGPLKFSNSLGVDTAKVTIECPAQGFDIHFSSNFLCSSLDTNGSCLQLRHPATNTIIPIVKANSTLCDSRKTSNSITVYVDTILSPDTFELVIKQGTDLNTLVSECFFETPAYEDTLTIIFPPQTFGELKGDHQGGTVYSNLISLNCFDSEFIVNLSDKVLCSSVAQDGSDFVLYNIVNLSTVLVKSALPICSSNGTSTRIRLVTDPIPAGNYLLKLKEGNDSSTIENKCNSSWPEDSILVHSQRLFPNLGPDLVYCEENKDYIHFLNPGVFHSYKWSDGTTIPTLLINKHGTYWVEVFNEKGCKDSDTVIVTTKKCYTSVDEIEEPTFTVYPVPAQNKIFITTDGNAESMNIKMFDLNGSLKEVFIKQIESNQFSIDISELSDGIYIIEIQKDSIISRKRVVKSSD